MDKFNLQDYEPVQDRIGRFYERHHLGRIITELAQWDEKGIVFKATLYADPDGQENGTPLSTGWAHEVPGAGYVNKTSALENCETSAIGRALANIGLHGDKRASLEEMEKVSHGQAQKHPRHQEQKPAPMTENQLIAGTRNGLVALGVPDDLLDIVLEQWRVDLAGDFGRMYAQARQMYADGIRYQNGEWVPK